MKNIKPILIFPDGTEREVTPANGKKFSLRELQGFVGGIIQYCKAKDGRDMVLNDEGKLCALPINEEATKLYEYGSLNPADWALNTHDFLVGTVLVSPRKYTN